MSDSIDPFMADVSAAVDEMNKVRNQFRRNLYLDGFLNDIHGLFQGGHLGVLEDELGEDEHLTRVSTYKVVIDVDELRCDRRKQAKLKEIILRFPHDIANLLNAHFPDPDPETVKVSSLEYYPSLDGFTLGIVASVLVWHKASDHAEHDCSEKHPNAYFMPSGALPMERALSLEDD